MNWRGTENAEREFFYGVSASVFRWRKKTQQIEEHTSEHEALIRAAGKQLERKIDITIFFIVLTFTSDSD